VKTGPLFLNLTLDGGNGAASLFDRFTPVVKLRFLFRPKFNSPYTVSPYFRLHLFKHFGFYSLYGIQSFLIYTLIILILTLFGCLHSIRLTAAYSINSNENSTFDLGLFDIQPLFQNY